MDKEIKNKKFNLYYLNFQKVYEISMMINNFVLTSISKESSKFFSKSFKLGGSVDSEVSSKFLAGIKATIKPEMKNESGNSSKIVQSLEVKTTKSILLNQLIIRAMEFKKENLVEGNLLKIDKVKLSLFDEEDARTVQMLKKDAVKSLSTPEGFDFSNLIKAMVHDYQFVLVGEIKNKDKNVEKIIFRIPMTLENEFENQYGIDDLLIGSVSLIGIYKSLEFAETIRANTLNFYTGKKDVPVEEKTEIISSDIENEDEITDDNKQSKYHFIDIVAIIQDVNFHVEKQEPRWYQRLIKWLLIWKK